MGRRNRTLCTDDRLLWTQTEAGHLLQQEEMQRIELQLLEYSGCLGNLLLSLENFQKLNLVPSKWLSWSRRFCATCQAVEVHS